MPFAKNERDRSQEAVDYHWLEDDMTLPQIGPATHNEANAKKHYKTVLQLKQNNADLMFPLLFAGEG